MVHDDPRAALANAAAHRGESLAALSRLIGRNAAYLQQFVTRGSPRVLAERDRGILAAYLAIDEALLGAPLSGSAASPLMPVPRLDALVSAGPGALVDADRATGAEALDPAVLRRLGVRMADASIVTARGESMLPTIADGDELLVNQADRAIGTGGIFVARLDGALVVKRLSRSDAGVRIISDNPAYPPLERADLDVIGRVVRLNRQPK